MTFSIYLHWRRKNPSLSLLFFWRCRTLAACWLTDTDSAGGSVPRRRRGRRKKEQERGRNRIRWWERQWTKWWRERERVPANHRKVLLLSEASLNSRVNLLILLKKTHTQKQANRHCKINLQSCTGIHSCVNKCDKFCKITLPFVLCVYMSSMKVYFLFLSVFLYIYESCDTRIHNYAWVQDVYSA